MLPIPVQGQFRTVICTYLNANKYCWKPSKLVRHLAKHACATPNLSVRRIQRLQTKQPSAIESQRSLTYDMRYAAQCTKVRIALADDSRQRWHYVPTPRQLSVVRRLYNAFCKSTKKLWESPVSVLHQAQGELIKQGWVRVLRKYSNDSRAHVRQRDRAAICNAIIALRVITNSRSKPIHQAMWLKRLI